MIPFLISIVSVMKTRRVLMKNERVPKTEGYLYKKFDGNAGEYFPHNHGKSCGSSQVKLELEVSQSRWDSSGAGMNNLLPFSIHLLLQKRRYFPLAFSLYMQCIREKVSIFLDSNLML